MEKVTNNIQIFSIEKEDPIYYLERDNGTNDLYKHVVGQFNNMEEEVIVKAVEQYTGNVFTTEDAKKVTRVYNPRISDEYQLAYAGSLLGIVHFKFYTNPLTIEFIPKD